MLAIVMKIIRHAELVVENSFGWSSTPTVHLIIQSNVSPIAGFVRQTNKLTKPVMGETVL